MNLPDDIRNVNKQDRVKSIQEMKDEIQAKQKKEALDRVNRRRWMEEESNKTASELAEMKLVVPPSGSSSQNPSARERAYKSEKTPSSSVLTRDETSYQ